MRWANHVIGGRELLLRIPLTSVSASHEAVQNGHMRMNKIPTEFQLADVLTKAQQVHQFEPSRTLGGCGRLRYLDPQKGGETNL